MLGSHTRRRVGVAVLAAAPLAIGWLVFNRPGRTVAPGADRLSELAVWAGLAALLLLVQRVRSRAIWVVAALLAAVMAVLRTLGAHYVPKASPPFLRFGRVWPLEVVTNWLVLTVVCVAALHLLTRTRPQDSPAPTGLAHRRWAWFVAGAVIPLLCWVPYYLIYFPGIVVRDSWSSIIMGRRIEPMSNHHPVVFTLMVGAAQDVAGWFGGGITLGVAIFSGAQAVLMALGLACCVVWMRRRFGRWPGVLALIFFALSPQVAMWSITMHKDSLFVVWITLLIVLMAETSIQGITWLIRPAPLAGFAALLLLVCFWRNNGPYIAVAMVVVVVALLAWRRWRGVGRSPADLDDPRGRARGWWRVPVVGAAVLGLVFVVQGPVYSRAGVIPSEYVESVGLPLQQIGWAVKYGHVTPAQERAISQFMPVDQIREKYSVTIADSLKFDKSFNTEWLNEHPDEFMAIWRDVMRTNLPGYGKAWYALAGGYVDPGTFFSRFDIGTKRGARMIQVHDRDLLGPQLGVTRLDQKVARAWAKYTAFPVLNLGFSMPLVFWLGVLAAAAALLRRRPVAILPHLPFVLLVGTLLIAAPVTDFRYVAAAHFALPVLLAMAWAGPRASLDSTAPQAEGLPADLEDADPDADTAEAVTPPPAGAAKDAAAS